MLLDIRCKADAPALSLTRAQLDGLQLQIEGEGSFGCEQFRMTFLALLFVRHIVLASLAMLVLGVFLCFWGLRMISPSCFILGFLLTLSLCGLLLSKNAGEHSALTLYFAGLLVLALGAIGGYLAMFIPAVGVGCLSLYSAYVIAQLLERYSTLLFYAAFLGLAGSAFYISYTQYRLFVIAATSIIGGYLFGMSAQNLVRRQVQDFSWPFIILGALIASSGIYWQYR